MAAKTFARFGHWPPTYLAMVHGAVPAWVIAAADRFRRSRFWEVPVDWSDYARPKVEEVVYDEQQSPKPSPKLSPGWEWLATYKGKE